LTLAQLTYRHGWKNAKSGMKYATKNRSQIFGFRLFPETSVLFKKQASGAFFLAAR
jgi:hypothetical protein